MSETTTAVCDCTTTYLAMRAKLPRRPKTAKQRRCKHRLAYLAPPARIRFGDCPGWIELPRMMRCQECFDSFPARQPTEGRDDG